jgi:hypothetical protein
MTAFLALFIASISFFISEIVILFLAVSVVDVSIIHAYRHRASIIIVFR